MAAASVPPAVPAPIPPPPLPMSQGARVVNTFIAPSKTFTDIRRSASWWAPWILIGVTALVFGFAMGKQVGFEQISKYQAEHSKRADQFNNLPADQQANQLRVTGKIVGIFSYFSPLLILLYALIATVTLWLTFKLLFGGQTTFGQAYAITIYGWLPGIIGAILGTIALFAGINPEGFDVNNPVGTNLAYYLDADTTSRFVRGMASALDVLSIWTIVLIGIGYACTSKVKRSTAIIVVAAWYLIFKLTMAALSA
ncbi:MAG TPA: YIP1 family protein [Candidatus Sulfotelmatobacter sp.]|jgi:hypothetical protein